jgi:hypothetical protein
MTDKLATKTAIEMITLKQLCTELEANPREAREKLRLAVRDARRTQNSRRATSRAKHGSGPRIRQL